MPLPRQAGFSRPTALTTFKEINMKPWLWNAFQKDPRYSHQREYRFAFSHYSSSQPDKPPKTEEDYREELLREYVPLNLTLRAGLLEIIGPEAA
jgi:hypothetical protein